MKPARVRNRETKVPVPRAPEAEYPRRVLTGHATHVRPDGRVQFTTTGGATVTCRAPMHISVPWLRAALQKGPVQAEASVGHDPESASLWSVFPGKEHEGVVPEEVEIAASESLRLVVGGSKVSLKRQDLLVRSREVVVTGARSTRIRGGTVKVN